MNVYPLPVAKAIALTASTTTPAIVLDLAFLGQNVQMTLMNVKQIILVTIMRLV